MNASPATTLAQEVRAIRPRQRVELSPVTTLRAHNGKVRSTLDRGWKRGDRRSHDFAIDVAMHAGRSILTLARKYERTGFAGAWRRRRIRQLARAYIAVAKAAAQDRGSPPLTIPGGGRR